VGLLISIVHAQRVRNPDEAAALYRSIGTTELTVDGLVVHEGAARARLLAAIDPARDATVIFEHGTLDARAIEALGPLASAGAGYLDVAGAAVSLRVWATHAWVHHRGVRPEALDDAARAIGDALGAPVSSLPPGTIAIGDATVEVTPVSPSDRAERTIFVKTPSAAAAFALFRTWIEVGAAMPYGFIGAPIDAGVIARLAPFLDALGGSVKVSLTLTPEGAARVARDFPVLGWQADELLVQLPAGEISTYRVAPVAADDEAAWHADIARRLRAIRGEADAG
jgi:hypothetical protein